MKTIHPVDIQITDLRKDIFKVVESAKIEKYLRILRRGKEIGFLIDPKFFKELLEELELLREKIEGLEETLEIMGDRELMKSLRKSIKELEEGKLKSWEGAFGEKL